MRMIFDTAATISGVSPGASAARLASVAASPRSISLCALPLGIIGKQFSCFSTSTSRMKGPS